MMNKIIVCLLFFLVYCAQELSSQSRFHIEVDYHYMFGLSEKGEIADFSRNEFKMYGNSLHLSGNYKLSEAWSTGIGIGSDRYENPGYNTFPVFATLQYFPLQTIPKGYVFTDVGYAFKTSTAVPGFLWNLGIGYKHMFRYHFGIKMQLGYNFKHLKNSLLDTDNMNFYSRYRHSFIIGMGVIF
ncbi:MAG: hypothetical protein XD81_1751 [Bacteroidetes bacterium 38_7]|nr:MAG: hypothetical protein XD81_1751 [Bacteroidetes bacterium 38_7]